MFRSFPAAKSFLTFASILTLSGPVFAAAEWTNINIDPAAPLTMTPAPAAPSQSPAQSEESSKPADGDETPQAVAVRRAHAWLMAGREGCLQEITHRSQSSVTKKGVARLPNGLFAVVAEKANEEICTCLFTDHGLTSDEMNVRCTRGI